MLQEVQGIFLLESWIRRKRILQEVNFISIIHYILIELSVDIIVSDINADMLEVGKKRAVDRGSFHGNNNYFIVNIFLDLKFMVLNAEKLE